MAATPTTTRRTGRTRAAPPKGPPAEHQLDAAALDYARDLIHRFGRTLEDGIHWFHETDFDGDVGPMLIRELVAMIYAAGFGYELAAAVLPYLLAESSTDGPDENQFWQANRSFARGGITAAQETLQRARAQLREGVAA